MNFREKFLSHGPPVHEEPHDASVRALDMCSKASCHKVIGALHDKLAQNMKFRRGYATRRVHY